jgi:tetratricopeptide (TPR) repeat protein
LGEQIDVSKSRQVPREQTGAAGTGCSKRAKVAQPGRMTPKKTFQRPLTQLSMRRFIKNSSGSVRVTVSAALRRVVVPLVSGGLVFAFAMPVSAQSGGQRSPAPAATSVAPSDAPPAPADTAPSTAAEAQPGAVDPMEEARLRYERGLSLFSSAEYVLALVEFERAYQLSPNYRVLYNIGQVRIQLARYARALEALTQYLKQGGDAIDPERRAAVEKDLQMLSERTAKLGVTCNEPGANITLDGIVIGVTPLSEPIIVDAGEHNVGIRKVGFYDRFQAVTLAGRDTLTVDLDLVKLKHDGPSVVVERRTERQIVERPGRPLMWAGWAATGTLGIGAGVAGYFGIQKAQELESKRTQYPLKQDEMQRTKRSAQTLFLAADLMGASAVVMGGISVYLTLSSSEKAVKKVTGRAPGKVRIGISPKGVKLSGSF